MSYAGKIRINEVDYPMASTLFGVCGSQAGTSAKSVDLTNFDALLDGVVIAIKFTNGNTAANPTLNINGTGARPIMLTETQAAGANGDLSWPAGCVQILAYEKVTDNSGYWYLANNDKVGLRTLAKNSAAEYSTATHYVKGDFCVRNLVLYEANDATTGTWDANKWDQVNVTGWADETMTALATSLVPYYDDTATYRINQLCLYSTDGTLGGMKVYRATVDITTAESFDSTKWEETSLAQEREYKLVLTDTVVGVASTATATVSGTGVTSATVDKSQWEMIIRTAGEYVFTFNGTDWTLDSRPVQPQNYGITLEGTPVSGDTVKVTYTEGRAAFIYTNTYPEYPYRAIVPRTEVKATMIPQVTFGLTEAISGMYAPIANTYDGEIHLYATNEPTGPITIPTIVCWG